MTSTEFTGWIVKLEKEHGEFHREDYYFAQLTSWIVRYIYGRANIKDEVKLEDFLLRFYREDDEEFELVKKGKKRNIQEMTDEEIAKNFTPEEIIAKKKAISDRGRMFWFPMVFGVKNVIGRDGFVVNQPPDPEIVRLENGKHVA